MLILFRKNLRNNYVYLIIRCMGLYGHVHILIPLCEAVITLFVIANLSLATFMDAGIIPKGKRVYYSSTF